jgi:hypothetical protein
MPLIISLQDWDTINVDWFSNRKEDIIPLPEYKLNFIWTVRRECFGVISP